MKFGLNRKFEFKKSFKLYHQILARAKMVVKCQDPYSGLHYKDPIVWLDGAGPPN
jgi:hypothetical protein